MGRFRKRKWGDLVESEDGFTVHVIGDGFPAVKIRYQEGSRTMDVFAERLVKTHHLSLDRSSMDGWQPPDASETVDDATRQRVLDRITEALNYSGYVIAPHSAFPAVRNRLEGQIQFDQMLAASKKRWREEAELLRKWREDGDQLEDHRRDDTPR